MEITNEKLYEMYTGLKADNEKKHAELRADIEKLYKMHAELRADHEKKHAELRADFEKMRVEMKAELKTEIAQLRSDIIKWVVGLFAGSMAIMTTILGVIIISVVL